MNISRPPLRGFVTSETFSTSFETENISIFYLAKLALHGEFKIEYFLHSCILISLDVVITKDQLSGDNKTNLVFMMRPIITRETERAESSQHTTRGSHYICRDFRDFVSRLLLTMTDGKIFYPASITSQKLTLSQYSHSQI